MSRLSLLNSDPTDFPEIERALTDPDGLLAVGGDLSAERIIQAYSKGIFPWYEDGQPILWWSPNPRMILYPQDLHLSRSLKKTIRKKPFQITTDQDFEGVLFGCAESRQGQDGTWITADMHEAYLNLHHLGIAHSIESWKDGHLVGGLYGLALGPVFFGESMFSRQTDASKIAFATLVQHLQKLGYQMIDCQVFTHHLASFGAIEIPREDFQKKLHQFLLPIISTAIQNTSPFFFEAGIQSLVQSTQWFQCEQLDISEN